MKLTMVAADRGSNPKRFFVSRTRWFMGLILAFLWLGDSPAWGQANPAGEDGKPLVDGLFISVSNPLRSPDFNRIQAQTERFRTGKEGREIKIVYDFNPDGTARTPSDGAGDFGICYNLANYLLKLQGVTTIAYVHNEVTGHNILPVLACREIVMSKNAKLGNGLGKQLDPLDKVEKKYYETVIETRRYIPAIVLKMIDKDMEVLEGTKAGSTWYVDKKQEAQEAAKEGFVPTGQVHYLAKGTTALYTADLAEKLGLCKKQLESRLEVKEAYRLPTRSLREEPLQGRKPNAWHIRISGPVDKAMQEKLEPKVKEIIHKQRANFIILQLESAGGETEVALELAKFFRALRDDNNEYPVMTVAYLTKGARGTATSIALGCTEIVMDKDAQLGGYDRLLQNRERYIDAIRKPLEELAEKQGYPPLLIRGMLDKNIAIHEVSRKGKEFEHHLMDGNELDADKAGDSKWNNRGQIKGPGELLSLPSGKAKELDLVAYIFEGKPGEELEWLKDKYGLEKINETPSGWRETLANYLCSSAVSYFLVILGITGLILEMKIPGFGLPGVVAAICFVLYFWAHSQMQGHLTMLAVLLFLLGLILIGLEVFLVPGLGITAISGVILIIASLGLVTLVKKPETTHEWMEFGRTLTILSLSLVGSMLGAFTIAHYLPNIPWANRMVLVPPGEKLEIIEEETARLENDAALLGAIGEAATVLRPAGKARFGDEYLDVVAEGSYVQAGAHVQVIEIEGNRIVVKEV